MSKNSTSKVVRYTRDNLPPDKTDWARLNAMTDEEVMAAALADPMRSPSRPSNWRRCGGYRASRSCGSASG